MSKCHLYYIYVKGVDLYLLLLSGEQLYRTTGLLWNTPLHSIYTTRQPAFVIRSVINNLDVAYIACLYFDFISIQENQSYLYAYTVNAIYFGVFT